MIPTVSNGVTELADGSDAEEIIEQGDNEDEEPVVVQR